MRRPISLATSLIVGVALSAAACSTSNPGSTFVDSVEYPPRTLDITSETPITQNPADSGLPRTTTAASDGQIELVEYGWTLLDNGFVTYGVQIKNLGKPTTYPSVTVTALDESGTPIESDTRDISFLDHDEEGLAGGTLIDAQDISTLEVVINEGDPVSPGSRPVHITTDSELLGTEYDTKIAMTATSDSDSTIRSPQTIHHVFRNSSGDIVGGMWGFTSSDIPAGGTLREATKFTGYAPGDATEVDSFISTFPK